MKWNKKSVGMPAGLGLGLLISTVITLAGAAAVSHMVATEKIGEEAVGYGAIVILAVSAAMGAWGAFALIKQLRLQVCMLSGACYYLLLLATTAMFFGGQYQGMGITAIAILAGCALVAFMPTKKGQNWKKVKKAYR